LPAIMSKIRTDTRIAVRVYDTGYSTKYKRGGHFRWPPLLEIGMLFQDGQVTARAIGFMRLCEPLTSLPNWITCITQLHPKLFSDKVQEL
jgi:hypothetical protein